MNKTLELIESRRKLTPGKLPWISVHKRYRSPVSVHSSVGKLARGLPSSDSKPWATRGSESSVGAMFVVVEWKDWK
jgi:hypothetical protein